MKINDQLSVLFLLEKSRPTKEGLLPLTVRITLEGVRAEFMLGKHVLPDFWNIVVHYKGCDCDTQPLSHPYDT